MKIKIVIILLLAPTFFALRAQDKDILDGWTYIQIDSTKQMWGDWNDPDWLRYFGLDAGDVDRDGNMDIVSGRYVYHNPGGSMEGHWKRTVLDDNVDAILCMDVDGDPYADIIAMALPNLYWYEAINQEGTKYKRKKIGQVPATSHVNSQGFEKAQIIAGGLEEFVIAGNGDIYAVEIPKKNAETTEWKVKMICENTSDEGIGVGDIDGDGDLDIAAGRRPDGEDEPKILVWYENPGNIDNLWKPTVVGESVHPIDRVEIADVNGDNKTDIIVTEERYPGLEPDANFWWFGQKSLSEWERNQIVEQYSINNLDITDFDNDGDIDLLTAEHKGETLELQLWKNDGKGNFSKNVLDTGKENHLGTQLVDLDNDGDLDIIGAGWDQHKYMHVWRNDAIKSLKTGMLFKDHSWVPDMVGDSGKFLRVGGKLDYAINKDHFPKDGHKNGFIPLNQDIDLTNAICAEVFVERVQSHEDTKNLKFQFNEGKPIRLHEPPIIPDTATNYMFHANIKVPVPLSDLENGTDNSFKMTVAKEQSWDWPQNIIYGVVLRVYYAPDEKKSPIAKISGISNGQALGDKVILSLESDRMADIAKVDYIGLYEDVNVQGDGKYRQWQFRYHRGKISNNIGSSNQAPFKITWKTDWLPDQQLPIAITALVTDSKGFVHVAPTIENLRLKRTPSVELLKPYNLPQYWTTRGGEFTEHLDLDFEPSKADAGQLYWNSWSPCYSVGIEINGVEQKPDASAPCYDAYWHEEPLANITSLKQGKNELKTLKTPLHDGQMVHGMDVQYPGIMLKVKRGNLKKNNIEISEGSYEDRPHFIIDTKAATYYFDKAGGGFSRIIDNYGNDWINYKTEPWDQYPASAASAYRGLPNLVFKSDVDGGAGHPGHDKCVSEIVAPNKIQTTTKSGLWQWEWTFHDGYAVLKVLKTEENKPYWFLYEGTPGGNYKPETSSYGTNVSGPHTDTPDFYKGSINWGDFQWAYFNKKGVENTFLVAQVTKDDHIDMMSYLGNSETGVASNDGMTVFGFGRGENTEPLLQGNNTFIVGLWNEEVTNKKTHQEISKYINDLIQKEQQ
jgi:hypothetical protein